MKLIDLYYQWMKTGKIFNDKQASGAGGLCNAVPRKYRETLNMFEPDENNYTLYWGQEKYKKGADLDNELMFDFTTRRQAVVLFICAIHNEL